jgi:hypothetical protein
MTTWSVKPEWKKSIVERQEFSKGSESFIVETGWRWGEFLVITEDDTPPILLSGVDIYNCDYETEFVETIDGCWEEYNYDECSEETREWLEAFLEDNSPYDLEDGGWVIVNTEMIIEGDLIIERVEE